MKDTLKAIAMFIMTIPMFIIVLSPSYIKTNIEEVHEYETTWKNIFRARRLRRKFPNNFATK